MKKNILIVVDMQKDFVTGVLGSGQAQEILPRVVNKVEKYDGEIIFTMDTHGEDYLNTQEGQKLPVVHCVEGTPGFELEEPLGVLCEKKGARIFKKGTFGSIALAKELAEEQQKIASIELIGVCTDICVVSNALLLKAFLPELPIQVDASCCAGVTPQKHEAALETMRSCQIHIV